MGSNHWRRGRPTWLCQALCHFFCHIVLTVELFFNTLNNIWNYNLVIPPTTPCLLTKYIILPLMSFHIKVKCLTLHWQNLVASLISFTCYIIIQHHSKCGVNIYVLLQTMKWIWLSIHQHKPRAMYLGLTPMLNHCRLSGSLNLLTTPSP